jgi:hypothetical protein
MLIAFLIVHGSSPGYSKPILEPATSVVPEQARECVIMLYYAASR